MRSVFAMFRFSGLLSLLLLTSVVGLGCDGETDDDDDTAPEGTPPEIIHEPLADGQVAFVEVDVDCIVTDDTGVSAATLYYRPAGIESWSFTYLNPTEEPGQYSGTIAASVVTADGVDYYIRAVDNGSPRAEAFSPEGAPDAFHHFDVDVTGQPLPFVEDWEGGSLSELGWVHVEQGFPDYTWEVSDLYANSGGYSAMHKEGINGVTMFADWLISPPLEFDGETEVAVSWWELGLYTADTEIHALYVSMGGADPADGDFELVAELPAAPEQWWDPSQLHDITDQVTEGVGYIAFYYEGEYPADKWFIDDLYVGEPIARFELDEVVVDPEDFGPGDSIDLTITVSNVSLVDSGEVTGSLQISDSLVEQTGPNVSYGVVASGASTSGDGAYTVTVDAEHVDNTDLEFTLRLDDGEHTWDLPFDVLMGEPSYATVSYAATASGELLMAVGHGDPAAPTFEESTEVDDQASWTVEITGESAFLPPDVGETRWWLRLQNEGLYPAVVESFEIDWGGVVFSCDEAPVTIWAESEQVIYLPSLPIMTAVGVATTPDPIEPGATGVELIVTVANTGTAATADLLMGTLTSSDPDVSNLSTDSASFGADVVEPGGEVSNAVPFAFDVDAGHTDDSDLEFTLQLSDGVDSYEVPVAVPVPWAHVEIEQLIIDDTPGNGDGILDRGETVMLTTVFRNTGDADVAGSISATLAQAATSEVDATLLDFVEEVAGGLAAGQTHIAVDAFELTADTGYMGDLLVLDIEITDGTDTWTQVEEMEIAARGWTEIAGATDDSWDANGYMFDIAQLWYKTDGEVLWLKTDSFTPFSTDTLWLTYAFYDVPNWWRLEYHYAFGGFRLVDDWFDGWFVGDEVTPTLPIIWETEADGGVYSFIFRILMEDLEVDGHSLRVGMHAGSCPFAYYCDTAPCTGSDSNGDGMTDCAGASDAWFYLDLANSLYGQESDNLYVFTW